MNSPYRWPHAVFGLFNLALTAPSVYLMLGLPLLMRQHGWSGTEIGLFQLAGIPALFKVLLALPVERYRPARQPYLRWSLLAGAGYLLTLLLLALLGVSTHKGVLFALILASALLATWADIPINALAIKLLPASERLRAGGMRSAALFSGAILGGGVMLLVQQALGWAAPFLLMSGLLLLALALLCTLKETADCQPAMPLPPLSVLGGFFRQPGVRPWSLLLLSYFPFVATAWVYLKPLLLDYGFSVSHVAWISGIGGGCLGAMSSIAAVRLVRRASLPSVLPLCALINFLVLALLTGVVWQGAGAAWLMGASFLLALAMGATSSLAFSLMMDFAREYSQAADYGIQASLFALGRLAVPPVAGVLLDRYHYQGMLLTLTLAALGVVILAATQRHVIARWS